MIKKSKDKICTCLCHMPGVTLHMMSCCDLTYQKYIKADGTIDMEKYNTLKLKTMKESDKFVELFNKFKALLDVKDYKSVNDLMKSFLNDASSVGELKTILIITKSFKDNEIISDARKEMVKLIESKLGTKLV